MIQRPVNPEPIIPVLLMLETAQDVVSSSVSRKTEMPLTDAATLWYLATVVMFGALSAFAALLGDSTKQLSARAVAAYILAGAAAAWGVVTLLVDYYGFSWFLLGVSVFAGYKAVDFLTVIGAAISGAINYGINKFKSK